MDHSGVDGVIEVFKYWLTSAIARAGTAFAQTFVRYSRKQAQHNSDALHTVRVLGVSQLQQPIPFQQAAAKAAAGHEVWMWSVSVHGLHTTSACDSCEWALI
jgi:hypothetical protein